ncbi:hypothetical protein MACH05_24240 [Qipengyuania nanhaisediminis]
MRARGRDTRVEISLDRSEIGRVYRIVEQVGEQIPFVEHVAGKGNLVGERTGPAAGGRVAAASARVRSASAASRERQSEGRTERGAPGD